jgi:hypothetical protein
VSLVLDGHLLQPVGCGEMAKGRVEHEESAAGMGGQLVADFLVQLGESGFQGGGPVGE